MTRISFTLLAALWPHLALAEAPTVVDVDLQKRGGAYSVHVTLAHPDTGWDHYADGWEVRDEAGNSLGLRVLHHPHVEEQPFTRSLSGVEIPDGTQAVFIVPRCSVDGWAETATRVDVPR
jgi:hypothetical protein